MKKEYNRVKEKKRNKKGKKGAQPDEIKLTLTIETLRYFDTIKVLPPSFSKDIDETIKRLNEKKEYFIKVSDDINEGKEGVKDEEKSEEKKEENEEEEKNVKKVNKKVKVSLDDEEMFPAMGDGVIEA